MFDVFKKTPTTAKITPKVLTTAMDDALNHAFGAYAVNDVDELIWQAGKSASQIVRMCLNDDEVASCVDDLLSAIKTRQWRIYDDVAKSHQGVDAELINKFYKHIRHHIATFAHLAITAKLSGFALAEYVYAQDEEGFIYIDKVIDKSRGEDFVIKADGSVIYQHSQSVDTRLKMLLLSNKPNNPMGEASVVKIYPAVLLRIKGWAYAGQFIARYAQPYVVGKQGGYGVGSFANKLFEFINGGAAGINKDDEIAIHQLNADGGAFDMLERLANRRIQKFLLGRVKTSELSSGSRSAQETDDTAREDRISGYLELMTTAIQHAIDATLAVNARFASPIANQGLWFEYVAPQVIDIGRAERDKIYCDTGQIRLTREYMIDMVGFEEHHFALIDGTTADDDQANQSKDKSDQSKDKSDQSKAKAKQNDQAKANAANSKADQGDKTANAKDKSNNAKHSQALSLHLSNAQNAQFASHKGDQNSDNLNRPNANLSNKGGDQSTKTASQSDQGDKTANLPDKKPSDDLLSLLNAEDFASFSDQLNAYLSDGGGSGNESDWDNLINALAQQGEQAYLDGLNDKKDHDHRHNDHDHKGA